MSKLKIQPDLFEKLLLALEAHGQFQSIVRDNVGNPIALDLTGTILIWEEIHEQEERASKD